MSFPRYERYKDSGVGRQNGTAGFDQYTEIKSVAYPAV